MKEWQNQNYTELRRGNKKIKDWKWRNNIMNERSEYKGNPMIELKWDEDDKYPFRFGVRKAQLIVNEIEAIKQFVEDKINGIR